MFLYRKRLAKLRLKLTRGLGPRNLRKEPLRLPGERSSHLYRKGTKSAVGCATGTKAFVDFVPSGLLFHDIRDPGPLRPNLVSADFGSKAVMLPKTVRRLLPRVAS
jgi:hypothetical protein